MVTSQAPVPVQAPLQPVNTEPLAGVAAMLTTVPESNSAVQATPQSIPAGALATVPLPVPDRFTVKRNRGAKRADMATSEFRSTVQVPLPTHGAEVQPTKTEPGAAAGVSFTLVPLVNVAEQAVPQLMPAGSLVTAPDPVIAMERVAWPGGAGPKLATTFWFALKERLHAPVPEQAPLQPVKALPRAGTTVRAMVLPVTKSLVQVSPQLMPAGLLTTMPPVAGTACTVKAKAGVAPAPLDMPPPPPPSMVFGLGPPPPPPHPAREVSSNTMPEKASFHHRPPSWFTEVSFRGTLPALSLGAQCWPRVNSPLTRGRNGLWDRSSVQWILQFARFFKKIAWDCTRSVLSYNSPVNFRVEGWQLS
jgi:hypothetical protein